ncbi:MAG: hypothetical protein P1U58_04170 [Verrucomicrobiales bacterium]|nr:hypothetical protein [Verrucomicrobiales bacterium]
MRSPSIFKADNRGYATFAMVAAISLAMLTLLTLNLAGSLKSMDVQKTAQMKQDYSQREDAILNSLLHIVPNKAIGAMKRDSADSVADYTWETIFDEALDLANAEQAVSPQLLGELGLDNAISANTGDSAVDNINTLIDRPSRSPLSGDGIVNGGNWWEYWMLFEDHLYDYLPAPLMVSNAHAVLDKTYPIVSEEKRYVYNYQSYNQIYHKGLQLSSDTYPLYNQLVYPDVKFGYKRPGDLFVAKRNWWVFSLTFGQNDVQNTGVPPVTRDYLLSIYEVPSQLPISSSTTMNVGAFADGTAWGNVTIDGSVYASRLNTEGDVEITDGALAARETVTVSNTTLVDGTKIENNFDDLGTRESRSADKGKSFYGASVSGNGGKVAFVPINRGNSFLWPGSDGDVSERISPTGWNYYSRGASQCAMRLEMREMASTSEQLATQVRFHYTADDGSVRTITYTRGDNWPTDAEAGGELFPFQTTQLENTRYAIAFYPNRLETFIDGIDDAAPLSVNNSICIYPNTGRATVNTPSIPAADDDPAVTLRGCKDLTNFPTGFSLVTRYRLYIAESFNIVQTAPPANSGLPSNAEFYPPSSLFAPEKRFGESVLVEHPVSIKGQLSSLKTSAGYQFNPLELQSGDDSTVGSTMVNADLVDLRTPAELPPVHMMNWLVTIEPIR